MVRPKGLIDRSKIAMDHAEEAKYWSKHFRLTPDELRRVIEKVGNSAAAVREELQLGSRRKLAFKPSSKNA